jgi:hypothetical protein
MGIAVFVAIPNNIEQLSAWVTVLSPVGYALVAVGRLTWRRLRKAKPTVTSPVRYESRRELRRKHPKLPF